jgi:hypothetical protein
MLFDAKPPKAPTGVRKYIPLPVLIVLAVVVIVVAYFELHNLPEEHAVGRFFAALEAGNYQEAYKLWQPAPSYHFEDFMHDWGPKGDYGKITQFKVIGDESKGNDLVIVTVQINNQTPPLDLVVARGSKGLAYSPY